MKHFFVKISKILLKTALILFALSIIITIIFRWINPPITPLMISRAVFDGDKIDKKWVPIRDISQSTIDCVIASEDNFFLAHNGIDIGAIEKAIEYNKKHKKTRGASTVSQQTAKNVFLWQSRTWIRKGFEVYFTFLIEICWSKERIMEVYLNVIEMGKGIYGIESAAKNYFGVSAKKLSPYQSALIVAAFPNPRRFNPKRPSPFLKNRANCILNLSYKIGNVKFDDNAIQKAKDRHAKYVEKQTKKRKK